MQIETFFNYKSIKVAIVASLCCFFLLLHWAELIHPSRVLLDALPVGDSSFIIPSIIEEESSDRLSLSSNFKNVTTATIASTRSGYERFLRHQIANVSIDMMMEFYDENEENNNLDFDNSLFVDITPLVDLVETALDNIGVHRVLTSLLEIHSFVGAFEHELQLRGMENQFSLKILDRTNSQGPQPVVDYKGRSNNCNGCLWWIWHYVGAIIADKLTRDGSLLLLHDSNNKTFINDARSMAEEFRSIQRSSDPDNIDFHGQHGFMWHYVKTTMPDLNEYPMEFVKDYCGEYVWNDEPIETHSYRKNDVGRDCRHSFGHAIFYLLAERQVKEDEESSSSLPVNIQLRPNGGFQLKESTICRAYEICSDGAVNPKLYGECIGGFRHSQGVMSIPLSGEEKPIELRKAEKKRCEEKMGKNLGYNKEKFG